ncbi:MAG TPA: SRPBCC family protein [Gemmatimonadaceae bacterium]|nr:SRPBCC family protein [Gemmatimonadaceae bacterium]
MIPHDASLLGSMPAIARMRTVDERIVRAPAGRMFEIAANVEQWPALLPHYRYVRFRERTGDLAGIVEMSANRPFGVVDWPTWWVSLMEIQHASGAPSPSIRFRHVGGITTRMEVEWSFAPIDASGAATRVMVLHLWDGPSWPLIGGLAARMVIGPVFVHGIASRTLEGLARVAERGQTSRAISRQQ